jgi:DNA-binding IclR family transcriptional regulator
LILGLHEEFLRKILQITFSFSEKVPTLVTMTDVVLAPNDAPTTATRSVTARALSILGVFSMERPSMTLSEISRATGLPVATVYRLAGELEEGRFLDRDEDGRYSLGLYLWEMGMLTPVHGRLREIAMPFLLNLQYTCRETVQLAVIDGVDAIYIEKLSMVESAPVQSRIGARIPLHATGVGKALLAFSSAAFVDTVLGMPLTRFTDETTTSRHTLVKQLAQVVDEGFAHSRQEYLTGSTSIAAPVLVNGIVKASIGIVNYEDSNLDAWAPALLHASEALGTRLEELRWGTKEEKK